MCAEKIIRVTPFIVIFILLWRSGTELAVSWDVSVFLFTFSNSPVVGTLGNQVSDMFSTDKPLRWDFLFLGD